MASSLMSCPHRSTKEGNCFLYFMANLSITCCKSWNSTYPDVFRSHKGNISSMTVLRRVRSRVSPLPSPTHMDGCRCSRACTSISAYSTKNCFWYGVMNNSETPQSLCRMRETASESICAITALDGRPTFSTSVTYLLAMCVRLVSVLAINATELAHRFGPCFNQKLIKKSVLRELALETLIGKLFFFNKVATFRSDWAEATRLMADSTRTKCRMFASLFIHQSKRSSVITIGLEGIAGALQVISLRAGSKTTSLFPAMVMFALPVTASASKVPFRKQILARV
mmetsp:Transcript_50970/g.91132  ORF Transcript_50970/g.91132 Transcript_50970/m.91132 type:complete len:283 (-) Transcript_50970:2911-3759(-)